MTRRMMLCPYEAPLPAHLREHASAGGVHPGFDVGPLPPGGRPGVDEIRRPQHCAGYTIKLPQVRARTWQRRWLDKGGHASLVARLGHEPTERDLDELQVLEAEYAASESWAIENPVKRSDP